MYIPQSGDTAGKVKDQTATDHLGQLNGLVSPKYLFILYFLFYFFFLHKRVDVE